MKQTRISSSFFMPARSLSPEQLEVPDDGEGRVPGGLVHRPGGSMAGIATGLDDCDVQAAVAHVVGRPIHERGRDPAPLKRRIDGDHVHDAHALVERVQRDGGEPNGFPVGDGDEDVPFLARATRPDRLGLDGPPLRLVKAVEDRVTQYCAERIEDRLPGSQRELDDGVEVRVPKRTDDDLGVHRRMTVAVWTPGPEPLRGTLAHTKELSDRVDLLVQLVPLVRDLALALARRRALEPEVDLVLQVITR